jgi:hypothetical protein
LWGDTVKTQGKDDTFVQYQPEKANSWLTHAAELGLGACDLAHIELVEQKIG